MELSDIISSILALIGIITAIWIPNKIKWEQLYASLVEEERSFDFGIALQGIIEFFVVECKNDVNNIKPLYRKHFEDEITNKKGKIDKENCLHFQRRLLGQFFWQLVLRRQRLLRGLLHVRPLHLRPWLQYWLSRCVYNRIKNNARSYLV